MDPPPIRPPRPGPALGAVAGVRQDLQAAKEAAQQLLQSGGDPSSFNPNAFGSAWTHGFLNKKPWHPMNFANRAKVWEAEHQHYDDECRKAEALKEFEAEQHYVKTLSLLDPAEQEKYKARQSVAWLYMKPPGFNDAAQLPAPEAKAPLHEETAAVASNEGAAQEGAVPPMFNTHTSSSSSHRTLASNSSGAGSNPLETTLPKW